jgi:pimeloyl-ACP methyl ester carboxylesterase
MRNTTQGDEQFLVFNIFNPPALRDNVRQSALEVVLLAHVLDKISIDTSGCPGATNPAKFDVDEVALMGHSMGASMAPLALAVEPIYRAAIFSGAGGSWIANAMDKLKPLAAKPSLEFLFGYTSGERALTPTDPVLTLVQWAPEAADVQVFARHLVDEPLVGAPRHVLMFQGIVDHYIMPRIANTLTLAAGLDLAGRELDDTPGELDTHPKLRDVLKLSGRQVIALPAAGNRDGTTAVVVQNAEDGIEDGHEVMWQLPSAHAQYRHFLETLAAGTPQVIQP